MYVSFLIIVATISETITNQTTRPPLLSTEKDHCLLTLNNSTTPKSTHISSRSHSTSSNSNLNSSSVDKPTPPRKSPSPVVKRSVSADRRRHTNNKTKTTPNLNNVRKGTPLRGKVKNGGGDHVENTKPMDQHSRPCKTHKATNTIFSKSLSFDHKLDKSKVIGSRNVIRSLHQSINNGGRSSLDLDSAGSPRSKLVKFSRDSSLSSPRTMVSPSVFMGSSMCSIGNFGTITMDTRRVLSFGFDGGRRKVGENWILDAHMLRLLYNRELQWRFVNARSEDMLLKRKRRTEKYLWNTWVTTADLSDSVTKKRHRLHLLRQKLKLASILKEQMGFLENWACLDEEHSRSLLGAIKDLKGSTLPVGGGAITDIQSMKDAISSAVVVMQAIGSSISSLCLKAEEVNSLVMEIANVSAKERALIRICKDLLSMLMALKVKDCSLRTDMLQKVCVQTV